jgi:hypothetical protein
MKVMRVIKGDLAIPAHGSREMPVRGNIFFEKSTGNTLEGQVQLRIRNLTEYIKTLQVT